MIQIHSLRDDSLLTTAVQGPQDLAAATHPAWVEVVAPTGEEAQWLTQALGLHELSLEDAMGRGHPPKLEGFEDHLFLIIHTPEPDEEGDTRKIALFLSKNWLVTVVRVPLPLLEPLAERVRRAPKRHLNPPAELAHQILDLMADGFEARVDELADRVEELEEAALTSPEPATMQSILGLRREAAAFRRVVRAQRDVCLDISREGHAGVPKRLQPYFRDVYDHVARVADLLEGIRDSVGAARDAYLSAVNNRLSEIMRVLTVIATIMMPLSLVAGIYGMNFAVMPGAELPLGFWLALLVMAAIAFAMLAFFRRRRWL